MQFKVKKTPRQYHCTARRSHLPALGISLVAPLRRTAQVHIHPLAQGSEFHTQYFLLCYALAHLRIHLGDLALKCRFSFNGFPLHFLQHGPQKKTSHQQQHNLKGLLSQRFKYNFEKFIHHIKLLWWRCRHGVVFSV